jgi:hypothetical protein
VLIFAPWQQTGHFGRGALAIVAAAVSYAIGFSYMGRTLVGKGIPTISLSEAQLQAATALTLPTLPAGGLVTVHIGYKALIAVVILGIFATGITFHLTYRIIADEGATNAATVGYLLPVGTPGEARFWNTGVDKLCRRVSHRILGHDQGEQSREPPVEFCAAQPVEPTGAFVALLDEAGGAQRREVVGPRGFRNRKSERSQVAIGGS